MSIAVTIPLTATRAEKYRLILPAFHALMDPAAGSIANMANAAALIKEAFDFHWVGFYLVRGEELVLGPFQGPTACTRIARGKGVCGQAWEQSRTLVVPDVELFPGHIACSPYSRSEIVLPLLLNGSIVAVLDIDSSELNDFSQTDVEGLTELLHLLTPCL
ncbi:MAG: GAF domain-containing protein [Bacteroidota bacterium]